MKFTALILAPVFLFSLFYRKFTSKEIYLFVSGCAIVIIPYFVWAQITYGNFLSPILLGSGMVTDFNAGHFFYLGEFFRVFGFIVPAGFLLFVYFFIRDFFRDRKENLKKDVLLLCWIIFFLFYISATAHKETRYFTPLLFPLLILSAKGIVMALEFFNEKIGRALFILLFVYLFLGIAPTFYLRLGSGIMIDETESIEMKVSHYIAEDLRHNGTLYTNHNMLVFAYYSKARVKKIFPYNDEFYRVFPNNMPESGLIIISNMEKNPKIAWISDQDNFVLLKQIDGVYIYNYSVKNKNMSKFYFQ